MTARFVSIAVCLFVAFAIAQPVIKSESEGRPIVPDSQIVPPGPFPGQASERSFPGQGSEHPVPGQGSEHPFPGQASERSFPGQGSEHPFPGQGSDRPIPGQGSEHPFPGQGSDHPFPGQGSERPDQHSERPFPGQESERPGQHSEQRPGQHSDDHPKQDSDKGKKYESEDDDKWHQPRVIIIAHDDKNVRIVSNSTQSNVTREKDSVHFGVSKDTVRVRFSLELFQGVAKAAAMRAAVSFISLVEFEEKSAQFNGYDDTDKVVSSVALDAASWTAITAPTVASEDGGSVYTISMSYGTLLQVDLTFGDAKFTAGTATYGPSQLKIDIIVTGYEFKGTGTYLALECAVQSPEAFEEKEKKANKTDSLLFNAAAADAAVAFGWDKTVVADGVEVAVVASKWKVADVDKYDASAASESAHKTFFAFAAVQPKKVVWDPYLGVEAAATTVTPTTDPTNGAASLAGSLLAVIALLAAHI